MSRDKRKWSRAIFYALLLLQIPIALCSETLDGKSPLDAEYGYDYFLKGWESRSPQRLFHVSLNMKNGNQKEGYLVLGDKGLKGFLKEFPFNAAQGRLYFSHCYQVNDGKPEKGYALCEEDAGFIDRNSIKDITFFSDQPNKTSRIYYLNREETEIMKKTLVFSETGENGPCDLVYFNYNPSIGQEELDNYVEEGRAAFDEVEFEKLKEKLKKKGIVVFFFGCDPTD